MNIESKLYKIIRGHFRLRVDGLFLLFREPTSELIGESYEVYDEAYDAAYGQNSCVDSEINNILVTNDIWNPHMEKELEKTQKELENLKVEAFESFFDAKALNAAKSKIYMHESQIELLLQRKHKLDHLSCHSVAENARWAWLISKCVSMYDNSSFPQDRFDHNTLLDLYRDNLVPHRHIRKLARGDTWRQIWNASKKTHNLFNRPAIDLSSEQLTLISYSSMYDNVHEHPEAPSDEIVNDDYCLDGWFIIQKRKHEKNKKANEVENIIKNPKIKNAKEVFIMGKNQEDANRIFAMNDSATRQKINERSKFIAANGTVEDKDLPDIRQEIQMAKVAAVRDHVKGRK
jgi:hypothetical protein